MRRLFLLLTSICVATIIGACSNNHNFSNLPNKAKLFLEKYFQGNSILFVEQEFDDGRLVTTVHLQDAIEIEFNNKGEWIEISCPHGISGELIPTPIYSFVEENYPSCFIVKIQRKSHNYQIELNNDVELIFNKEGKFIRID